MTVNTLPSTVDFDGSPLPVVPHDGATWFTAETLGKALGLKHSRTGVNRIYIRHHEEFTDQEVSEVTLTSQGQGRNTRIFSPQGARLVAMLANTPQAARFRRWILELLDSMEAGDTTPEVAELETRLYAVAGLMFHMNPVLLKVQTYYNMGLNYNEIAKLVGRGKDWTRATALQMADAGLLQLRPSRKALKAGGAA